MLDQNLAGLRVGNQARPKSVIVYADVTIFVTSIAGFPIIEANRLFERASGARLNPKKSKAIAVGGWCTHETVLGIDHTHATILGITFLSTIAQNNQRQMGEADESTSAGKTSVHQGPVYRTQDKIRSRIPVVQTLLHRASVASGTAIHTAANYCHHMAHLEGSSI